MADAAEAGFLAVQSPGTPTKGVEGATLASAATMAPTSYIHYVTGTAEVTLITLPYTGFAGTICFIPAGAFTGATGGTATATNKPVGKAFTAVAAKALYLTYVPSLGLWYPSYVS